MSCECAKNFVWCLSMEKMVYMASTNDRKDSYNAVIMSRSNVSYARVFSLKFDHWLASASTIILLVSCNVIYICAGILLNYFNALCVQ